MATLITLLPGDGIGPEVTAAARRVLEAMSSRHGIDLVFEEHLIGGAAIDECNDPLPAATLDACRRSQAVMLGAVGGPKWSDPNASVRPEQGLLGLRAALGVYANLRPVTILPQLADASPLRRERLEGVDILVIRELTGGIYFGEKTRDASAASDLCVYTVPEVERILRVAAKQARQRRGRLCSVDKANVLETSRLWRDVANRLLPAEFPDIEVEHMLVDAASMHLINRPADFDVIVTENMFGDILTDEASMLAGSMGMLPSASLGDGGVGLYEPIHGSAPDIAGKGLANPCGMLASVAMAFRHSFGNDDAATAIEQAIASVIAAGGRTADIAAGGDALSTTAFTDRVVAALDSTKPA